MIVVGGEPLQLLPQRAAYVAAHRTLLVADAHFGKAISFRRLGVPVPDGTTAGTLARLADALSATAAERIVFLGDFLHSAHARSARLHDELRGWRLAHREVALQLVRGNHDRRAGDPPATLGIEAVDEPLHLGALALQHHPRPASGRYAICGHLHPGVSLGGRAHDRLRLPCFHFGPEIGVLPAFGEFTGLQTIERVAGDRVFVVADGEVHEAG